MTTEPNGRDWLVDQYGERAVMDIERATLDAARLSHDRGADAWTRDPESDDERHVLNAPGDRGSLIIFGGREHADFIMRALSVPAPTLPALDAETLERAYLRVVDQRPTKVEVTFHYGDDLPAEHQRAAFLRDLIREYEALRDAV